MASVELLEREGALEALRAAFERAAERHGSVALIHGEAGIGKSSLVRAFATSLAGSRVLSGACDDLLTARPLGPLRDLAPDLGGALREALLGDVEPARILELLLDELVTSEEPVVLLVEDAHWADEATLDVLTVLGRRIERLPLLLAITYRDDELTAAHPLHRVVGAMPPAATVTVPLDPLSSRAIAVLAEDAGNDAEELLRETGGNPFFVTELLAAHREGVPATVTYSVLARIARLPEETRDLLELLSVVPARAETWLLDACMPGWMLAASPAESRGMVRVEAGAVRFRHELARRTVESALPELRRRQLNAGVLEVLREREAEPARLAHHAEAAGDVDAAITFGTLAGRRAAAFNAHREAVAHLRRVLKHAGRIEPAERAALWQLYSLECFNSDAREGAVEGSREALALRRELGEPRALSDAARWAGRVAWWTGDGAAARELVDEAVALLDGGEPSVELARALAHRAQFAHFDSDPELAEELCARAIEMAEQLGAHEVRGWALANLGTSRFSRRYDDGEMLEQAIEVLREHRVHDEVARGYMNLGAIAWARRQYDRAEAWLEAGSTFARDHELLAYLDYMTSNQVLTWLDRGEWDRALEAGEPLIADPDGPMTVFPARLAVGRILSRRGDPRATAILEHAWTRAEPTREMQRVVAAAISVAEHTWLRGRSMSAEVPRLRTAYRMATAARIPRAIGELALWLDRAGALDGIPELAEEPYALMLAGRYVEAAEVWRRYGCPYEEAEALSWTDDRDLLRESLAILDRLGAEPLAARVRAKMRDLGVRSIPRGPQAATRANPAGLTARQTDVLRLLVEGLTNAEIAERLVLSTRTVDHHVSAILAKLDVETRAQAGRRAQEIGLL